MRTPFSLSLFRIKKLQIAVYCIFTLSLCLNGCGESENPVSEGQHIESAQFQPTLTELNQDQSLPDVLPPAQVESELLEDGPWFVFQGYINNPEVNELLAMNWDGTGLTRLLPNSYVFQYQRQPAIEAQEPKFIAAITTEYWTDEFSLIILELPDVNIVTDFKLTNPQIELIDHPGTQPDSSSNQDYHRRAIASMAISDLRSVVWSPDGTKVAFVGAPEGQVTNIFMYSLNSGEFEQITYSEHLNNISNISWSPDGELISYEEIIREDYVYESSSVWIVDTQNHNSTQLTSRDEWPTLTGVTPYPGFRLDAVLWLSDDEIAVQATFLDDKQHYNLTVYNIKTREQKILVPDGFYYDSVYDPVSDTWLVTHSTLDMDYQAYLITDDDWMPVDLGPSSPLNWLPSLQSFVSPGGLLTLDGSYSPHDLPSKYLPLVSPDGQYWGFPYMMEEKYFNEWWRTDISGGDLYISEAGTQSAEIHRGNYRILAWSHDGGSVLIYDAGKGKLLIGFPPDFELNPILDIRIERSSGPWYLGRSFD